MQILQTPEPFSPAFGEVLYTLRIDQSELGAEIDILDGDERIGVKKAAQAPVCILNVTDHLRTRVDIAPLPVQPCGIVEARQRTFYSRIAHRELAAGQPHTAGIVPVAPNEPMCSPGVRYLAEDEQDEISWVAGAGTVFARALFPRPGMEPLDIHLGRFESDEPCLLALIVNGGDLGRLLAGRGGQWEGQERFTVELHFGYRQIRSFDYRIQPHNPHKTRLAWWNRHGGVDLHSFGSTTEELLFEGAACRTVLTLRTAFTTRQQALRLSGIPGAPKVWIVGRDDRRPVEVLPGEPFPIDDPQKTTLQIRVADTGATHFQTL